MIVSLTVVFSQAQTVIEFAKDKPTITITDDIDGIIKTAVANIQSRTISTINVDSTIYLIDYNAGVYTISIRFWEDATHTKEHIEILFTGTRVADVRIFMKEELHTFYKEV